MRLCAPACVCLRLRRALFIWFLAALALSTLRPIFISLVPSRLCQPLSHSLLSSQQAKQSWQVSVDLSACVVGLGPLTPRCRPQHAHTAARCQSASYTAHPCAERASQLRSFCFAPLERETRTPKPSGNPRAVVSLSDGHHLALVSVYVLLASVCERLTPMLRACLAPAPLFSISTERSTPPLGRLERHQTL